MIEFDHVSKRYENGTEALKDVSLKIEKGEFVFVVGSSGAGKSTFLKLIMREEVPSSGTITIDGQVLNKIRKRAIPKFRRKLGIVFQDFRLIPNMTVFDNVAFAMRVIGTKEKKIRRRVPYLLSLMGLNEKARSYPKELSGGEQQRVALARALANNAAIIIADEPTGNVDPQMSYEIVDLLMRLNEAGTTVIMVTHEHSLVRAFDKRVIILEKGAVVSDGDNLDRKSATAHINAASEIATENTELPEEDYTAYATASAIEAAAAEIEAAQELTPAPEEVAVQEAAPAEPAQPEAEEEFDLAQAVAEVLADDAPAQPEEPPAEDEIEVFDAVIELEADDAIPAPEEAPAEPPAAEPEAQAAEAPAEPQEAAKPAEEEEEIDLTLVEEIAPDAPAPEPDATPDAEETDGGEIDG